MRKKGTQAGRETAKKGVEEEEEKAVRQRGGCQFHVGCHRFLKRDLHVVGLWLVALLKMNLLSVSGAGGGLTVLCSPPRCRLSAG